MALLSASVTALFSAAAIEFWSIKRLDLIDALGSRVAAIAVVIGTVAAASGLVAYLFFHRYLGRPLARLEAAAGHVARGDPAFRAGIARPKEIARLGRTLSAMVEMIFRSQLSADIDALTGIFNFRHARNYLKTQLELAARYGRHLTIAMIDIDHFQEINDIYGHEAGDMVLAQAAAYLKGGLRQVDYVARYGGEEFLVVLPETAAAAAMPVIERLRAGFSENIFIEKAGSRNPVFVSAGVADFPRSGEDETNLMAAADMALVAAKRRGRNQVAYFRALDREAG